jgi:hypothetical protein
MHFDADTIDGVVDQLSTNTTVLDSLPGINKLDMTPDKLAGLLKSIEPTLVDSDVDYCETGPRGAERAPCTGVSWIDMYK